MGGVSLLPTHRHAEVRTVQPGDEAALSRIAYETGFFGESAAVYFPARTLFGRLWITPYLRGMNPCGFVAAGPGGLRGYIVGAPDWPTYHRAVRRTVPLSLGAAWPERAHLAPSAAFLLRSALCGLPHADPARYPAHLHLNLLASARGQRLGEALLETYLEHLRGLGAGGVQLSTTLENVAAVRLYRKFGFEVLASALTPLWTPYLGRPAQLVTMGRRL